MNDNKKVGWRPHEGLFVRGVENTIQDVVNVLGNTGKREIERVEGFVRRGGGEVAMGQPSGESQWQLSS